LDNTPYLRRRESIADQPAIRVGVQKRTEVPITEQATMAAETEICVLF
jgi:hypothetical protein